MSGTVRATEGGYVVRTFEPQYMGPWNDGA